MEQSVIFDQALLDRYDRPGPRYTSYPSAVEFHPMDEEQYRKAIAESNGDPIPNALSLYVHIPFCNTVCYYCGCNKVITANHRRTIPYLENLEKEIRIQGNLFDHDRMVDQLHFGGGTPTYLSNEQLSQVMAAIGENFNLREDDSGEYSIEIDPRSVDEHTIDLLRLLGFNRISFGVQDFNPDVQKAVNRIQSYEQSRDVIEAARNANFCSINLDLIYGLPLQTVSTFARTLEQIIDLDPDRIAIYNYAHLPHLFKPQRQINENDLPSPREKLEILQLAINELTQAGYVYIGMDHFAKPDNELAVAQRNGELYRNFQGYSTHARCDVVGLGVTSIGKVANVYTQNRKTLGEYAEDIKDRHIPIFRGFTMNYDDQLRADIISQLICNFELTMSRHEHTYHISFREYFADEIERLRQMQADGLVKISDDRIDVLPSGRLLIRNICTVFDKYLQDKAVPENFSKLI